MPTVPATVGVAGTTPTSQPPLGSEPGINPTNEAVTTQMGGATTEMGGATTVVGGGDFTLDFVVPTRDAVVKISPVNKTREQVTAILNERVRG